MITSYDVRLDPATPSFRPALDAERQACRMLLPDTSCWAWPAEYLVAMGDSPRQLLGALAFTPTLQAGRPSWFVALRVIRTHRRQGIGLRLMETLVDRARSGGVPTLLSHVEAGSNPDAADFLEAAGFRPARSMTTFEGEIDLDRYEAVYRPICDRLEARGKVPTDLRIVGLKEAPLGQVSLLYAGNLGGTIDGVEVFLRGALRRGGLGASYAMMIGERVVGLQLLDVQGSVVEVHAKIVAPKYRGGWANALMTREFVGRLRSCGKRRVRFSAADDVHYTLTFAERYSVETVKVATQFVREL
jgi:GNAT superfamily N-acetyltransferase